jgi:hypothetical protein
MQATGAEPMEPYPGAHQPWRVRCVRCQRVVAPTLSSARRQGPCVYCAGNRVDHTEVLRAMRNARLEPLDAFPGSDTPWPCQCRRCQRLVTPRYSGIKRGQGGCVYCSRRRIDPTEAFIVMRRAGLEPLEPYPGHNKALWRSQCGTCGDVVYPLYNTIQQGLGRGCDRCGKVRGGLGRRVAEHEAAVIMRAAGAEPLESYPTDRVPWRCRCHRCKREIHPRFANVRKGQNACAYCAGHRVDVALAIAAMIKSGVRPLVEFPGSDELWESECLSPYCGVIVSPRYSSIKAGQGGCTSCAEYGFDDSAPALIYLVISTTWAAIKVGIANVGSTRLAEHRRYGWLPHVGAGGVSLWQLITGRDARRIERMVLKWWREELDATAAMTAVQMPHGGYRETAFLADVDAGHTAARINALIAEAGGRPHGGNKGGPIGGVAPVSLASSSNSMPRIETGWRTSAPHVAEH